MICHKKSCDLQHPNAKGTTRQGNFTVYKGLLMALLAGIFYCSAAVLVKQMKNLHPGQLAIYRFVAVFSLSLPQAVKCKESLLGPRNLRILLLLCSISGVTSIYLSFISYRYLPLGESAVIIYSAPAFVTVAARIFLEEPCGIVQSFAVLTTVVGVVLTTKISQKLAGISIVYTKEYTYGVLASVGSLLFRVAYYILNRKVKSAHHSVITFNCGCVAILETVVLTYLIGNFKLHQCGLQSIYIILICVFSYGAQACLTIALQCELAGPVTTMRCASEIILAFLCQIFLFNDVPDIYSLSGAALVGLSIVCFSFIKWVSSLREESPYKRKLNWIIK